MESFSYFLVGVAILFYPHIFGGGARPDCEIMIQLILFIAFAFFALSKIASNKKILENTVFTKPLSALIPLVIVSTSFAKNKPIAIESLILIASYFACFFILLSMFKSEVYKWIAVYAIPMVTLILCIIGLIEFYGLNKMADSFFRFRGTFSKSNLMAGWLCMVIPFFIALMVSKKHSKIMNIFFIFVLTILIISQIFTFARGGWIATFFGLVFVLITQRRVPPKKLLIYTSISILAVLLFILSNADISKRFGSLLDSNYERTSSGRIVLAKAAIKMIKTHPLIGVGPGNYPNEFTDFEPPRSSKLDYNMNDYLQFICEIGLLLLPIIFWMVFIYFKQGFSNLKSCKPQNRTVIIGAMGGTIALLIYSFGDLNFHAPANALLFIALISLTTAPVNIIPANHKNHEVLL